MQLENKRIGFAITGSHCTIPDVLPVIKKIVDKGADVYPIVSESVQRTDTRFGKAKDIWDYLTATTGKTPITTIVESEPIGPKKLLDCLVIAPCTGNTAAKLANGIIDGCVTMAAKAQLRNERPVVLAISTNDALGLNAKNIGVLMSTPHIMFVPYGQDKPYTEINSMVAVMEKIPDTIEFALEDRQIQPMVVGPFE